MYFLLSGYKIEKQKLTKDIDLLQIPHLIPILLHEKYPKREFSTFPVTKVVFKKVRYSLSLRQNFEQ